MPDCRPGTSRTRPILGFMAASLAVLLGVCPVFAGEQPTAQDIISALKPSGKIKRGITQSSPTDDRFVDGLRNRPTRSLSLSERDEIASIAEKKPSIDLEINFDYDSDAIGARALPQVQALGDALTSGALKGSTFVLAGYTDAQGGDAYNQSLSERRADAVKRYLTEKRRVDAAKLVTVGYGKTRLKDSSHPNAADNRRVQIVNMTDK
jgi:outer membrane protein OmpA-like peptidoglycan-associated protein